MENMRKKINFGKIDYYQRGRKINAVDLEIELRKSDTDKPTFSVCCNVWNASHTDIIAGGQCLDDANIVRKMAHNRLYMEILNLWKKYHLNDMHAGTPTQEKCLQEHKNESDAIRRQLEQAHPYYNCKYLQPNISQYEIDCEILKKYGLYEVTHDGKPYKYGHGWLYEPIPQKDLQRIKEIIDGAIL